MPAARNRLIEEPSLNNFNHLFEVYEESSSDVDYIENSLKGENKKNSKEDNYTNNWRAAIRKEIRSMIERGVWRKTDRKKIPNNRRLIGNKWVFKIKRDGTYRARLVALGYSQIPIPGVDYTDNFAPVAHDVSFRIALARMMVKNWTVW